SHAGAAWRRMSPESSPGWADGRPVSPAGGEFLRNFNGGGQPLNAGLNQGVPESQSEVTAMCDTTSQGARGSAVARPSWGVLYGTALPQLAALGAVEVVQSPHAVRIALRSLMVFTVFTSVSVCLRGQLLTFNIWSW